MLGFFKFIACFFFMFFLANTARADLDLFSRIYLSNKKYAENINIQAYLVSRSQLNGYFNTELPPVIQQLKNKDLYKRKDQSLFLLVECKNTGERYAFGELVFEVQGMNMIIPVYCSGISGNMDTFVNCAIIHLGSLAVFDKDDFPSITYSWKHLYTY